MATPMMGSIVVAPNGYLDLHAGTQYHFLHCDTNYPRVLLVKLSYVSQPRAQLLAMRLAKFEEGLTGGKILTLASRPALPPWLREIEGASIEAREACRRSRKQSYADYLARRVGHIAPLVERWESVLHARDPRTEINRAARAASPPQHETRMRAWFLTYLIFGFREEALLPPFQLSGRWSREIGDTSAKRGRPSLSQGKGAGHNMIRANGHRCADGFRQYAKTGGTWIDAYNDTMKHVFGALVAMDSGGKARYFHPDGDAIPSFGQFRSWVVKLVGLDAAQRQLYGDERVRRRMRASKGSSVADISKLLQEVEEDAYYVGERPRGFIHAHPLDPLCVVRIRCKLSGALVGIGFSLGKERNEAYRMALFCQAIPKPFFCALIGMSIETEEWPMVGLSPSRVDDRGPGAKPIAGGHASMLKITPSHSPRSKPNAESGHPKNRVLDGAPSFVVSELNPVQLARREIRQAIRDNHTKHMSSRITPELIQHKVMLNPLGLWRFFAERARTSAVYISIDDAVRTYLSRTTLPLTERGVRWASLLYSSSELQATGVLDAMAQGEDPPEVTVYRMSICVRVIWAEVKGRLLPLEVQRPYMTDEAQFDLSESEMVEMEAAVQAAKSEFANHLPAAHQHAASKFEEETGMAWNGRQRRRGRPKKSAEAAAEQAAFAPYADVRAA